MKKHLFLEFISEMLAYSEDQWFDSEEEDTDEGDTSDELTDEESDEDW